MPTPDELLLRAEELAGSDAMLQLLTATWRDPDVARRFDERPAETLKEFAIEVPKGLDVVPLGTGSIGKPGPDFEPFTIRLSRCRTTYVRDPDSKRLKTETVCFGIEIVRNPVPGGPIGRPR